MRFRSIAFGGALIAGLSMSGHAQSIGDMVVSDVRNGVVDMASVWLTPFRASGRDWAIALGVIAGSAAISPLDDDAARWFSKHEHANGWSVLKELREGGVAFSGKTITPVVGGLYVIGLATKSTPIRDGVWGCAASYASSSIVRNYVFYEVVGRRRPDPVRGKHELSFSAREGDQYKFKAFPGSEWGMHSLPAGHVANIAACASYLGNRFDMSYFEPIPYLIAAGVGVGRILDRRHWTSDTVLGAVFGYAVGKEVALRSLRRHESSKRSASGQEPEPRAFFVAPDAGGVNVGWQWTF